MKKPLNIKTLISIIGVGTSLLSQKADSSETFEINENDLQMIKNKSLFSHEQTYQENHDEKLKKYDEDSVRNHNKKTLDRKNKKKFKENYSGSEKISSFLEPESDQLLGPKESKDSLETNHIQNDKSDDQKLYPSISHIIKKENKVSKKIFEDDKDPIETSKNVRDQSTNLENKNALDSRSQQYENIDHLSKNNTFDVYHEKDGSDLASYHSTVNSQIKKKDKLNLHQSDKFLQQQENQQRFKIAENKDIESVDSVFLNDLNAFESNIKPISKKTALKKSPFKQQKTKYHSKNFKQKVKSDFSKSKILDHEKDLESDNSIQKNIVSYDDKLINDDHKNIPVLNSIPNIKQESSLRTPHNIQKDQLFENHVSDDLITEPRYQSNYSSDLNNKYNNQYNEPIHFPESIREPQFHPIVLPSNQTDSNLQSLADPIKEIPQESYFNSQKSQNFNKKYNYKRNRQNIYKKEDSNLIQPQKNKFALLIGNSDYKLTKQALSSAVNDVELIKASLINHAGYPVDQSKTLINPTENELISTAQAMAAQMNSHSILFLFYTGLGVNIKGQDYFACCNANDFCNPKDMINKKALFKLFADQGARVFAFYQSNRKMDGNDYFGKYETAVSSIAQMQSTIPGGKVISCKYQGKEHGLFAMGIATALEDYRSKSIPLREFSWQVYDRMRRSGGGTIGGSSYQTPTLPVLNQLGSDIAF